MYRAVARTRKRDAKLERKSDVCVCVCVLACVRARARVSMYVWPRELR